MARWLKRSTQTEARAGTVPHGGESTLLRVRRYRGHAEPAPQAAG